MACNYLGFKFSEHLRNNAKLSEILEMQMNDFVDFEKCEKK